jgi:cell division protein FtsI (penicillin-binding protein 3)
MDIKKDILWRVYLCFIGMIILGMVVLGRAMYIQQVQGKFWRSKGDSLHLRYLPLQAERGSIYSEDGNMLSTSVPIFDVYIDFAADGLREKNGQRFRENIDSLSFYLSRLFVNKTAKAFKSELQAAYKRKDRYYPLRKKMSFVEYKQLRTFPLVRLGRNKSGFIIDARDKRINPYQLLANRTIGLSREDSTKNVGLEKTYDSLLKGTTGQRLMRYIAGAYLPVEGAEVEPENGKDIITTLDTYMQDVAEEALLEMMYGNNSLHGTAIVMETATGKIKAIANLGKQPDGTYIEDLNYGIGKRTEPGSVFKLATLLCLLEDKYADINTLVDCEGGVKSFHGLRIRDSHLGAGTVTLKEAFAASSNVAFAKLADQYYHEQPAKFIDHLHRMRLDTLTGVDIIASSGYPIIKKPRSRTWSATTIPFMAHGYEALVTPLHLLTLYNAIANNGKMMRPYLVNAIMDYGVEVKRIEPEVLSEKLFSDATIAQAKEALFEVVQSKHGTGHKILFDSTYTIAGKTGTAVTALNNKGYNKGNKIYQSSFIGYFPAEKPTYSIAVVIQNSNESKLFYGADVAGRVFKKISDKIYGRFLNSVHFVFSGKADSVPSYYNGLRSDLATIFGWMRLPYLDSAKGNTLIAAAGIPAQSVWRPFVATPGNGQVPNVAGMGLKDAIQILEDQGAKITITGRGKVFSQSPMAGTPLRKGQTINLILN